MYTGPNISRDGMIFGYDTGYGVSNNLVSTRFNLGEPTTNLSNNTTLEKRGNNEYLAYESIVGIIDTYGVGTYSFSFDLKSDIAGLFSVYTTDGAERKYTFTSKSVSATTNWNRYNITVDITLVNTAFTVNNISFYGTYGTGKIPTVKNMQIEKKSHSTPFTTTSRSNTESLLDISGNNNTIDLNNVLFDLNCQIYFSGSSTIHVPFDVATVDVPWTLECVFKRNGPTGNHQSLMGNSGTSPSGSGKFLGVHSSGYPWSLLYDGSGTQQQVSATNIIMEYGVYYHMLLTHDGTTVNLYHNGSLAKTSQVTGFTPNPTPVNVFTIGMERNAYWPLYGEVPISKIYKIALTQKEVSQNFNAYKNRFNIN